MKKVSKVAILIFVLIVATFIVTACPGKSKIEISVGEGDMPSRTTFVRGQELDLFGGTLTVVSNGETTYVPLDDPDIKLSYDKDTLGKVTVTIEYKGATTTIDLTIIPRLELKNFNLDYFVGESFDLNTGSLVYNDDTGTSKTYALTDSNITISGFDSGSTGTKTAEIVYKDYTDSFNYAVHSLASKDYGVPRKTDYQSHETQIDLDGGYIQYKSSDDYVRRISLTQDMVSGFNPEVATIEHRLPAKACAQTITIDFPGFDFETSSRGIKFTYNIDIHYSDVSFIKDCAKELKGLEFHYDEETGIISYPDSTILTDALIDKAAEATQLFAALEDEDKALITEDEIAWIARPAVTGYFYRLYEEIEKYTDIVIFNADAPNFVLKNYDVTKAFYNEFSAPGAKQKPIFGISKFLVDFIDEDSYWEVRNIDAMTDVEFANMGGTLEYFYGNNVVDFNLFVDIYVPAIGKFLEMYDMLDETVIPVSWTLDTLTSAQENAIISLYRWLSDGNMSSYKGTYYSNSTSYRAFYTQMSKWRQKNDFFDIILSYYYKQLLLASNNTIKEQAQDVLYDIVNNFQMPSAIEDIYANIYMALSEYSTISQSTQYGYYYETTGFIRYYLDTLGIIENVRSEDSTDELSKYIVNNIKIYGVLTSNGVPVDALIDDIFTALRNSIYLTYVGSMAEEPAFNDMWKMYVKVLKNDSNGEYLVDGKLTEKFRTDIAELITMYNSLTPGQQSSFYGSFSLYDNVSAFMQYEDGSFLNTFARFVFGYISNLLEEEIITENMGQLIGTMFISQDYFTLGNIESFRGTMENIIIYYEDLTVNELQKLSDLGFKSFLDKLNTIYSLYRSGNVYTPNLEGEDAELVDTFTADISKALVVLQAILTDGDGDGVSDMPIYGVFVSACEKVYELDEAILAALEENQALYFAYYYGSYDILGTEEYYSLESYVWTLRTYFDNYLMSLYVPYKGSTELLSNVYEESGLRDFVKQSADFLLAVTIMEEGETAPNMSKIPFDEVKEIVKSFNELGDEQQMAFVAMHQAYDYVYDMYLQGLILYFADMFDYNANNDSNIIFALYRMQMAYLDYVYTKEYSVNLPEELWQQIVQAYNTSVENFYAAYGNLSSDKKELFEEIFGQTIDRSIEFYDGTASNPRA